MLFQDYMYVCVCGVCAGFHQDYMFGGGRGNIAGGLGAVDTKRYTCMPS